MVEELVLTGGVVSQDRTVLCCDWPPLTGYHANGWVLLRGWAHSPDGIGQIRFAVDRDAWPVRFGLPRPDVAAEHGIDPMIGFAARFDAREWGQGEHEVSLSAVGHDGSRAQLRGMITVSKHGAYRAWREQLRPGRLSSLLGPRPALSRPGHIVQVSGRPLTEELQQLVARGRGHLLLVAPGGQLAPRARPVVAHAFEVAPVPDLVYADEDALVEDGGVGAEFLKPGWSPELLLATDYIGPLVGVGPRAAEAALEAAPAPIPSIYQLCLALIDADLLVERIAEPLFTCDRPRTAEDDPSVRRAIEAAGRRRGYRPQITPAQPAGARHVGWEIDGVPRVSIVISTAEDALATCLSCVRRTLYPHFELVLVVHGEAGLHLHQGLLEGLRHRVVPYDDGGRPFSLARALNLGAGAARGQYLLFLAGDIEVIDPQWLDRMLEHAQLDGVGAVGAKLVTSGGDVQHAGINVARGAGEIHDLFAGLPADDPGYRDLLCLARNCSAVSAACMMTPMKLFEELDGFEEGYSDEYFDADFCHRLTDAGQRIVWTPRARLAAGSELWPPRITGNGDLELYRDRWDGRFREPDPYYHPSLSDFPSYEYRQPMTAGNLATSA